MAYRRKSKRTASKKQRLNDRSTGCLSFGPKVTAHGRGRMVYGPRHDAPNRALGSSR